MAATIHGLLSVRETSASHFESIYNPEKMGNAANIAYGGNTLGVAITAALQTVPSHYFLYSALGNYLGPAFTDRKLECSVRALRTTKTFATRHIEIIQVQNNGEKRLCLFVTADFQTAEPASLLTYSRPPRMTYSSVKNSPTLEENRQDMLDRGLIDQKTMALSDVLFGLATRFFDRRPCPEGVITQNLTGLAKTGTPTTQDHLPLTSKTSGDYFRSKHILETPAQHVAALAFVIDMATSFLPLVHNGRSLTDAGAQSSLDFAFRVFANDVNLNEWQLRELSTITGGDGRTYTEAQVWDQDGKMVCNMTQQSILRPKIEGAAKL